MDNIEQLLNQRAQSSDAPQDQLEQLLANRASAQDDGRYDGQPIVVSGLPQNQSDVSFKGRVGQGMLDPLNAGAALLNHSLPDNVVSGVNSATKYVNDLPVIGGITKALGMVPASGNEIDSSIAKQNDDYEASRKLSGKSGFDGGRALGNIITAAPLAAAGPAGGGILTGAGMGALNGLLTPVTNVNHQNFDGSTTNNYWEQVRGNAGTGALLGGVLSPVINLAGQVVKGAGGDAQKMLADAGVTMTPGQVMGGALARTEEKLSSVPVLGDMIKSGQARAINGMNIGAYNRVLSPIGESFEGKAGNEGFKEVADKVGAAYQNSLGPLSLNMNDPQFQADITKIGGMAQMLPEAQRNQFMNTLKTQIFSKSGPQGLTDGNTLQGIMEELKNASSGLKSDPSFDNRSLGNAIGEVRNSVENSLSRTNSPENVAAYDAARNSYAQYARLRQAAASTGAGNNGGIFSAAQLNSAVRSQDKSAGKGAFAKGDALMQDYSQAAQDVLGNKVPDSGTAGRSLMALGGAALAGHSLLPLAASIPLGAAVGAATLPYTSAGQKIAQALLMSRPDFAQPAGDFIQKYGTLSAPAITNAIANNNRN